MSTYEILPYMFEPESDVENESGQDEQSDQQTLPTLQDHSEEMGQSFGQLRSIGIQVNLPETTEKPSRHYIVEEEAIVQLMQNCPVCKRKCRCRKRIQGICVVFYQGCYFCDYQRKWASQPDASTINIHTTHTRRKKKQPKDKRSIKAKIPSSQFKETIVPESSVSESHDLLETEETLPTLS